MAQSQPIMAACGDFMAGINKLWASLWDRLFNMRLFDYVYYRIYKFYLGFGESGPWAFGIPAMAMSHFFILITVDRIIFKLGGQREYLTGTTGNYIIGLILVFNFVRYKWFVKFDSLQKRWTNEERGQMFVRGILVLIYLFGSLFSMLYLTDFFNRK
jgi:hypothetical protein